MPELLANGKLGDVVTSGLILDYIKKPLSKVDYSWLGVKPGMYTLLILLSLWKF